jgi:3-oxoacyl-[acyl-carrier protein] reductase
MGGIGSERGSAALVTGAARGIGFAIARGLGVAGFRVILTDISPDVDASAEALRQQGIDAVSLRMNVGDEQSVRSVASDVADRFACLRVLVNNAGVSPKHNGYKLPISDTSLDEWESVMRINLGGPFMLCRELLPIMRRSSWGRIINIASVVARFASPLTGGPYAASKVGLISFSRGLALELNGTGLTVNCVAPGRIVTPLSQQYDPSVDREYIPRVPLRRLGQPEDIANAVSFLASRDADAITGTVIDVNGGTFCN